VPGVVPATPDATMLAKIVETKTKLAVSSKPAIDDGKDVLGLFSVTANKDAPKEELLKLLKLADEPANEGDEGDKVVAPPAVMMKAVQALAKEPTNDELKAKQALLKQKIELKLKNTRPIDDQLNVTDLDESWQPKQLLELERTARNDVSQIAAATMVERDGSDGNSVGVDPAGKLHSASLHSTYSTLHFTPLHSTPLIFKFYISLYISLLSISSSPSLTIQREAPSPSPSRRCRPRTIARCGRASRARSRTSTS